MLSDRALAPSCVLRCEFVVSDSPVGVPTLMQVRWIKKAAGKRDYKLGLQFLL